MLERPSTTSTTDSALTIGPRASRVTAASTVKAAMASRAMRLCISATAPRRKATTLSGSPELPSVRSMPAASMRTVASTNDTSATPATVAAVVARRCHKLRAW